MKFLLVLAVVMVGVWVWRHNRQADRDAAPQRPRTPTPRAPVVMVACRACGTHLAQDDALPGKKGPYCSAEHRQQLEGPAT